MSSGENVDSVLYANPVYQKIRELYKRYLKASNLVAKRHAVRELQEQLSGIVVKWIGWVEPGEVVVAYSDIIVHDVDKMLREIADFLGDVGYSIVVTTEKWSEARDEAIPDKYEYAKRAKLLGLKLKDASTAFMELASNDIATAYVVFSLKVAPVADPRPLW